MECKNPLIPGLPNELSLECMARVPKHHHGDMKCVSVQWRDLVGSALWYSHRKRRGLEEAWLYALAKDRFGELRCFVLDPAQADEGWRKVRGVPYEWTGRRAFGLVALGKLFCLVGGRGWPEDATGQVSCYDANDGCWLSRFALMPTPRYNFACQAVEGKIFALGGEGADLSIPKSLDCYNHETRRWTCQASPNSLGCVKDSVVLNGKIYARCRDTKTVAYDISKGEWEDVGPEMSKGWKGQAAVVDGTLYVLSPREGMMKWQEEGKSWVSAGEVGYVIPSSKLAAVGKKIYMVGRGLHTAVFNTENGGDSQTLCYPEWTTSDVNVLGCVSVAT